MTKKIIPAMLVALMPILGYAQSRVDVDFDDNGVVDFRDFLAFVSAYGSNQARYDLDRNGVVDFADFLIFTDAYGRRDTSAVGPITERVDEREASAEVGFFELSAPNSHPQDLAIDPRGYVWFTDMGANAIGRLDPRTGAVHDIHLTTPGARPHSIVLDSGSRVWFSEIGANRIGRLDTFSEEVQTFRIPTPGSRPTRLSFDAHGRLWFIESTADQIGRLDPATERMEEFSIRDRDVDLSGLQIDEDGRIWFARARDQLGRLDPDNGRDTTFALPDSSLEIGQMGLDSEGRVWFTDANLRRLGVFDPADSQTRFFQLPKKMSPSALYVGLNDRVWIGGRQSRWLVGFNFQDRMFTVYALPDEGTVIENLRVDPRTGVVWIVDSAGSRIGRIETPNF